jgi:hypothetical protein
MIKSISFKSFRGLDSLNMPLSQVTMLTGVNGIGKTSILEGLYCLFSETRLDVAALARYNRTFGVMINQAPNAPAGIAARHIFNYRLFWEECPSYGETACSVTAFDTENLKWSWDYKKASMVDLDKQMLTNNHVLIDSSTEFALWNWKIHGVKLNMKNHQKEQVSDKFSRAQILLPDGGLIFLPQTSQVKSVCRYLDFASLRIQPPVLSFETSKHLTGALKIINPRVTDIRLTGTESGLSVVLDNTREVTLGTIGNGAVTWTSALIAIFNVIESLKNQQPTDVPIIILVDEIGAGIHYSVMLDMWKYLRDFTKQYPYIQFVTTSHSDDCVRAFCEAFREQSSASIVRLHKTSVDNRIIPTAYSKEQFGNIISGDWEVRG